MCSPRESNNGRAPATGMVLRVPKRNLGHAFDLLAAMPRDLMAGGRQEEPPQEREYL